MKDSSIDSFRRLDEFWDNRVPESSSTYQISRFRIELLFSSSFLADQLGKAFAHLPLFSFSKADLSIRILDVASEPGKLPLLDWGMIDHFGYRGIYRPPVYWHHFAGIGALTVLHLEENRAYYIVRNGRELPWWVGGSPFQPILHAWFRERKIQLTHAGAVGKGNQAVLLAGKGGSGKSTTVLSCLRAGLDCFAEDYCLLELKDPPRVYSAYQTAKWSLATRKFFPEYESSIQNREEADREKALLFYRDLFPEQLRQEGSIRALLSLRIGTGSLPELKRQDRSEGLKALMMSTLSQLPFHQKPTIDILASFISKIDCFELTLGQDLEANGNLIKELVE